MRKHTDDATFEPTDVTAAKVGMSRRRALGIGVAASGVGVATAVATHAIAQSTSHSSGGVVGASNDEAGVAGFSKRNDGVYGSSEDGAGVRAASVSAAGVIGSSMSSAGVVGSSMSAAGVSGDSGPEGLGGTFSGGRAQIYLAPSLTVAGPPTSGTHLAGELFMDMTASLYLCKAAGTPGTWKLLG